MANELVSDQNPGPTGPDATIGKRMKRFRLLLASNNAGKVAEFSDLLRGIPLDIVVPMDLGLAFEPTEDGTTYAENATRKAVAFASARSELIVLADDSGLEIAAFDGWPGIHSVRFAGPTADDATRRKLILDRLGDRPPAMRRARFVCTVTVARGNGILAQGSGYLDGTIAHAETGTGGFGYDPIFIPIGHDRSLGELSSGEKNRISHRAMAVAQIRPFLARIAKSGNQ
jgi:XTP/dITP diphosphohydrolase